MTQVCHTTGISVLAAAINHALGNKALIVNNLQLKDSVQNDDAPMDIYSGDILLLVNVANTCMLLKWEVEIEAYILGDSYEGGVTVCGSTQSNGYPEFLFSPHNIPEFSDAACHRISWADEQDLTEQLVDELHRLNQELALNELRLSYPAIDAAALDSCNVYKADTGHTEQLHKPHALDVLRLAALFSERMTSTPDSGIDTIVQSPHNLSLCSNPFLSFIQTGQNEYLARSGHNYYRCSHQMLINASIALIF